MRADPHTDIRDDLADRIVTEARGWLGVPWRHQGRSRSGVDCVGLIVQVARALQLSEYDSTAYSRRPEGQGFVQHFRDHLTAIPIPEAQPGDVLLFADLAYPCHCGLRTTLRGVPHLLHAHALRRKVIEEPFAGEWPDKARFAFRFPQSES